MQRKFRVLFLLFALANTSLFAQNITVQKDVIYRDDNPYAKVETKGDPAAPSYHIRTLKGDDVLTARNDIESKGYLITFAESGQQVIMKGEPNFIKKLAAAMIESNMICNGVCNPMADNHFMGTYGYGSVPVDRNSPKGMGPKPDKPANYTLVKRDHKKPFVFAPDYIKQDNTKIATYTTDIGEEANKDKTYNFFLPDGTKIAQSEVVTAKVYTCKVTTMKDSKVYKLEISGRDQIGILKEITTFLCSKDYL